MSFRLSDLLRKGRLRDNDQEDSGNGRKLSECIAIAKAYEKNLGYAPVPDADFAADVQAAIDAHREPLNPPEWD